jgi:hypothetical protein
MNVFTTEHPLTSQPSWFERREYPVLSFVCSVFVSALILTPVILGGLYYYDLSDIGAEATPLPDSGLDFFIGCVFSFIVSLVCSLLVVTGYRLVAGIYRRRMGGGVLKKFPDRQ